MERFRLASLGATKSLLVLSGEGRDEGKRDDMDGTDVRLSVEHKHSGLYPR